MCDPPLPKRALCGNAVDTVLTDNALIYPVVNVVKDVCVFSTLKPVSVKTTTCSLTKLHDAMLTTLGPPRAYRGRRAAHLLAQAHKNSLLTPTMSRFDGRTLGRAKLICTRGPRFTKTNRAAGLLVHKRGGVQNNMLHATLKLMQGGRHFAFARHQSRVGRHLVFRDTVQKHKVTTAQTAITDGLVHASRPSPVVGRFVHECKRPRAGLTPALNAAVAGRDLVFRDTVQKHKVTAAQTAITDGLVQASRPVVGRFVHEYKRPRAGLTPALNAAVAGRGRSAASALQSAVLTEVTSHARARPPRTSLIAVKIAHKYKRTRACLTSTLNTAVTGHDAGTGSRAVVGTVQTAKVATVTSRPRGAAAGRDAAVTSPAPRIINTLQRCLSAWRALQPGEWILRSITHGYRLQFSRRPPLTRTVIPTVATGQALVTLREEVQVLLSKGAIQKVNLEESPAGFYSKYFLIEKKKQGTMRPILDLRGLNMYLKRLRFKMLTTSSLLNGVRRGTWFTSVDLKDAFFHVSIYPPHRKFLRFSLDGEVYQFTVLPFGMSLSPRVFTKCTQAAVAPLRAQGIRLNTYLDDWLISADSQQEASRHTETVISHLTSLGFILNYEKSSLVPSQQTTFLGVVLDSTTLWARLTPERIQRFLACVAAFQAGAHVPYKFCEKVSGFMASAIHLIRLGRYYMRPFQKWMRALRIPSSQGSRKVYVTAACMRTLLPWRRAALLSYGVRMGMIRSLKVITTDASLMGWGAIHDGRSAKGTWSPALRTNHINYLELMAVLLALKRFEPFVKDCHVLIRTDNTAAMYYINKQGGMVSPTLDVLARELTLWCDSRLRSIRATHLAGLQNSGADLLSRGRYYYDDWSLHPGVANQIFVRYGSPEVDLFASEENAKCARFFSIRGTAPLGLEALTHDWPGGLLYAFPPLRLIHQVLDRVRRLSLSVLLVAPGWGTWRSEIAPLLYDHPWRLPPLRDLVSQADGDIFHPRPVELDLWVWPVRGTAWLPLD